MDDIIQAEKFNKELDILIFGASGIGETEPAMREDLKMASRLLSSDLSRQSRVKSRLRAELLGRGAVVGPARPQSILLRLALTPYGALAALILAVPLAYQALNSYYLRRNHAIVHSWSAGYHAGYTGTAGSGPSASPFAGGGSPYEPGMSGLAAGGLLGASGNVIQPLNVRDPRAFDYRGVASVRGSAAAGMGLRERYKESAGKLAARGDMLYVLPGAPRPEPISQAEFDTEGYDLIVENEFQKASDQPLSTFSIDVDAASYANTRRFLGEGRMPPPDAVRIEEFINYFKYDYPEPTGEHPFSILTEVSACPWKPEHQLARIGIKGKSMPVEKLPANNLVFLVDSSGSMQSYDKLPLLKQGLRLLVEQLRPVDRVAIVTYAGSAGLVLPSTPGSKKVEILAALDSLEAGGSTAGGAGIVLAYKVAAENFMKKGNNRVILATDGDFNVGVTSDGDLTRLIEEKRGQGVFLTVLGFGTGNYQDAKMEKLADKGNGNYAYIDDILEARKVLVSEMGGTLLTIAKDVKLQVEFNPARVQAYRLIGYENRMLKAEDFNNDKKDAGELGSGHTVTALYELIPAGVEANLPSVDGLKYQKTELSAGASDSKELLTVKFRYKKPDGDKSLLITRPLQDESRAWTEASEDHRFAASAAGFAMLLRGSKFSGNLTYKKIKDLAGELKALDPDGYRADFFRLVDKARLLDQRQR